MKIVITDLDHADQDIERKVFARANLDFELLSCKTEDDLIVSAKGASIALNQYAPFNKRVFEALPDLKLVVRYGVGVDNIDLKDAEAAGVQISNVPDYGMHEVSMHAIAMSMALLRKTKFVGEAVSRGVWDYTEAIPIRRHSETVIGVLGVGRIGALFSSKMSTLGFNVFAYDKYRSVPYVKDNDRINYVDSNTVVENADLLALFCPLNEENYHMIDASTFARMKHGSFLVNTARGGLVDEDALADAMAAGRIAGAALDTTETEPLPANSRLRAFDTCLLTPHMAWYSEDAARDLKRKVAEEAVRFARGEPISWGLVPAASVTR